MPSIIGTWLNVEEEEEEEEEGGGGDEEEDGEEEIKSSYSLTHFFLPSEISKRTLIWFQDCH